MGLSLKDWLIQVRLVEVRIRLRGNDSIREIALSVGLANSKELSREFRKGYGLSPSEFRNKEKARYCELRILGK
jgi:AraC-like DNA-binding protein